MSERSPQEWLDTVGAMRVWRRGGRRAPHKPLLLLWAIGRLQGGQTNSVSYEEAEEPLSILLDEFGPATRSSPSFPFARLARDGLWQARSAGGESVQASDDTPGRLRAIGAIGMLDPNFANALASDPDLLSAVVHRILDDQFPPTIQSDVLAQVGISLEGDAVVGGPVNDVRRRAPGFRDQVLMAYERACAMCGFDSQLSAGSPGLEAAHVRWFNYDGPDDVSNGLCLCSIHHKLFDRGVLGLTHERTITVSQRYTGRSEAATSMVMSLSGKDLATPQPGFESISEDHIEWHSDQVFKSPARIAS